MMAQRVRPRGCRGRPEEGAGGSGWPEDGLPRGWEDPSSSRSHSALQHTRRGCAHREGTGRARCRAAYEADRQRERL